MKRASILLMAIGTMLFSFINTNAQSLDVEHQVMQNGNVLAFYHFNAPNGMEYAIDSTSWTLSGYYGDTLDYEVTEGVDSSFIFDSEYFTDSNTYAIEVIVYYTIAGNSESIYDSTMFTYGVQGNGDCNLEAWYYIDYPSGPNMNDGDINLVVTGGSGAYTYQWNTGATEQMLGNINPGVYSVTITDAQDPNCSVVLYDIYVDAIDSFSSDIVDTFSVVVDTCLPSFDVDTFYLSNMNWNISSQDTTFSITWNFVVNGTTYSFVENYDYEDAGYYWLSLGFNCDNMNKAVTSYGRSVYVDPSSIENVQIANNIVSGIYPNPVKDVLFVDVNKVKNTVVEIYSISGQLIKSQTITETHSAVNTSKLDKGVYMLIIKENGTPVYSEKIVK